MVSFLGFAPTSLLRPPFGLGLDGGDRGGVGSDGIEEVSEVALGSCASEGGFSGGVSECGRVGCAAGFDWGEEAWSWEASHFFASKESSGTSTMALETVSWNCCLGNVAYATNVSIVPANLYFFSILTIFGVSMEAFNSDEAPVKDSWNLLQASSRALHLCDKPIVDGKSDERRTFLHPPRWLRHQFSNALFLDQSFLTLSLNIQRRFE